MLAVTPVTIIMANCNYERDVNNLPCSIFGYLVQVVAMKQCQIACFVPVYVLNILVCTY